MAEGEVTELTGRDLFADADDQLHNKLLDRALRREPRAEQPEFY